MNVHDSSINSTCHSRFVTVDTQQSKHSEASPSTFRSTASGVKKDMNQAMRTLPKLTDENIHGKTYNAVGVKSNSLPRKDIDCLLDLDKANAIMFLRGKLKEHAKKDNLTLTPKSSLTFKASVEIHEYLKTPTATFTVEQLATKNGSGEKKIAALKLEGLDIAEAQQLNEALGLNDKVLETYSEDLKKASAQLTKKDEEINSLNKAKTDIEKELHNLKSDLEKTSNKREELEKKIEVLQKKSQEKADGLGELMNKAEERDKFKAELDDLLSKYKELQTSEETAKNNIAIKNKELNEFHAKTGTLEREVEAEKHKRNTAEQYASAAEQRASAAEQHASETDRIRTMAIDTSIPKADVETSVSVISNTVTAGAIGALSMLLATIIIDIVKANTNNDADLEEAERELNNAQNDDNYVKQGQDAADAAVSKQIDKDQKDYLAAQGDPNADTSEIENRYGKKEDGSPDFNKDSLTTEGKDFMSDVSEKARATGIDEVQTKVVERAQKVVDTIKEERDDKSRNFSILINTFASLTGLTALISVGKLALNHHNNKKEHKNIDGENPAIKGNKSTTEVERYETTPARSRFLNSSSSSSSSSSS